MGRAMIFPLLTPSLLLSERMLKFRLIPPLLMKLLGFWLILGHE